MERTKINQLKEHIGKKVLLKGWIHEIRNQSKVKFVILRDSSGIIQLVILPDKKIFDKIVTVPRESVIIVEGLVKEEKQAPMGIEVHIDKYEVLSEAEKELPILVNEKIGGAELPKRLDWRSIDLRKPKNLAIFKVQAALLEGIQDYLNKEGFTQIFTPSIMGVPSESGAEMFSLDYFGKAAFLRQDPQLHRQLAIAGGIEKIYEIGPSWRAELSHTVKHLCEHRTCAVELSFIESEQDTMRVEEQLIIAALNNVKKKCKEELKLLGVKLNIPEAPFPELRFPEIYEILKKMGKNIPYGEDLDTEAEKLLWEYVQKKYKSEFWFINRFPFKKKPFYVMRVDDAPEFARSVDLYFKDIEMSSGGQRENRYTDLMNNVKEKKMDPKKVEWFTKFFKYGVPPHGGFGLGIERLTQVLLGLENIREAVLFARDPERLTP